MFLRTCIVLFLVFSSHNHVVKALPHQHPFPDDVAEEVHRSVNAATTRRQMYPTSGDLTGNPIDDCWRGDPNWESNRQALANCGVGFGKHALGGKGGEIYVVTDSSDSDTADPKPGTLRHAVIQAEPLWIIFETDMTINLKHELILNSFKTIDGRGANIHITGNGCLTLQSITNVIIHNVHIHHCKPSAGGQVRSSPTRVNKEGKSEGDGISIRSSQKIWVDHCSFSYCYDGLVDASLGSTAITVSNNYFSHQDKAMMLSHDDSYTMDSGMQVTIAFNRFGEELGQRMPRCRHGYFHVVNNDYVKWQMYAIGGSANPTINSQGNRFTAPDSANKEVTKRVQAEESEWMRWNWRSEGDVMVNGAFFTPSGSGTSTKYTNATSVAPKSVKAIEQLTINAGVLVLHAPK